MYISIRRRLRAFALAVTKSQAALGEPRNYVGGSMSTYELACKEAFGKRVGAICLDRRSAWRPRAGESEAWLSAFNAYMESGVMTKDPHTGTWAACFCPIRFTEWQAQELASLAGDHAVMRRRRLAAYIGTAWPPLRDYLHESLHGGKQCPGPTT